MNIQGFNYVTHKAMSRTREEWRVMIENVLDDGGRRRVEKGETFAHDSRGVILFEVYDNVSVADISDLL